MSAMRPIISRSLCSAGANIVAISKLPSRIPTIAVSIEESFSTRKILSRELSIGVICDSVGTYSQCSTGSQSCCSPHYR